MGARGREARSPGGGFCGTEQTDRARFILGIGATKEVFANLSA